MAGKQPPEPPKGTRARRPSKAVKEQVASVTPLHRRGGQRAADGNRQGRNDPKRPENIVIAERRARAYNMRRAGLTFQQIADQISDLYELPTYTRQRAHEDYDALRDEIVVEPAKDQLYADLDRLNALQVAIWPAAMGGDIKAVGMALKLLERRARYLGLDSPIRHVLTGEDGGPIQIADLADPAKAYAAALAALDEALPAQPKRRELPGAR